MRASFSEELSARKAERKENYATWAVPVSGGSSWEGRGGLCNFKAVGDEGIPRLGELGGTVS